jgi:Zn-dependent protease with chaperone function
MTNARYFDGHDARMHPVSLTVAGGRLHIAAPGLARSVALDAVKPTEPFARAPLMLRLDGGGRCELPPGPASAALLDALGYRRGMVARWQSHRLRALLALPLLAALMALLYLGVLPVLTSPIAATLPLTVDLDLGRSELDAMEKHGELQPSQLSPERIAEVEALLTQALPPHPRLPIRLVLSSAAPDGPNASALPDGTIVVTDSLVHLFETPDGRLDADGKAELLAVLGHEVGHIERRHRMHKLAQRSLAAVLSSVLFGDVSAMAGMLPARLSSLHYSRDMEMEADDHAVALLRRKGLGSKPVVRMLAALQSVERNGAEAPRGLDAVAQRYLSTHPATAERIARLGGLPAPASPAGAQVHSADKTRVPASAGPTAITASPASGPAGSQSRP